MKIIRALILFLALVSCSEENKLETALSMSGANRGELEKVLRHYSVNKSDTLKLRAAKFLIENMPGHFSYSGKYFESYIKQLNSQNPTMPIGLKSHLYSIPFLDDDILDVLEKKEDIETVKADFLIKNIDYKFKLWKSVVWGDKISFDDFCETILPYRTNTEPVEDICTDSLERHIERLESILQSINGCEISIYDFKEYITDKIFNRTNKLRSVTLPSDRGEYNFDCVVTANTNLEEYRAVGIPVFIDFTPHWATDDSRHVWNTYIDPNEKRANVNYNNSNKFAKIYRTTFSHNKSPRQDKNRIPHIFTPFIKDVTNEYIKTSDIEVFYDNCDKYGIRNVYLSVFNQLKWREVAWSEIDSKNKAAFSDVGTDVVYIPTYYLEDEQVVADYPFILTTDGTINKLIPNKQECVTLRLTRKYPKDIHKIMWEENIVGGAIEASNNPDFINSDTIYQIKEKTHDSEYSIDVKSDKKYRYFRVAQSPERIKMFIAELSFTDEAGRKVKGKIITPVNKKDLPKGYLTAQKELEAVLYDNDPLSYSTTIGWVGVDFGKPMSIKNINITLRSDANYIYPNNSYELFYHDKNQWVSLGVKKATDKYIEFDNAPSGALYWLRNLSSGREERIFTYENNRMRFW